MTWQRLVGSASGVVLAIVCLWPAPAAAQDSPRPFRALFGGAENDPKSSQQLDLKMSLLWNYDDNVIGDTDGDGSRQDSGYQQSGTFPALRAALVYRRKPGRFSFGANAETQVRYYPNLSNFVAMRHHGGLNAEIKVTSRTRVEIEQFGSYSPIYALQVAPLFDAEAMPDASGDLDFSIAKRKTLGSSSSVRLAQQITSRLSLFAAGELQLTHFPDDRNSVRREMGAARLDYRLTRYATLRAGYRDSTFRFPGGRPVQNNGIDAGIDYNRALSFSRRTTLSFGSGSDIVDNGTGPRYHVNGAVNVNHQMGRSWTARGGYRRGLVVLEGLEQLAYADSVGVEIAGYVIPRLDLTIDGRFSTGSLDATAAAANDLELYSAVGTFRLALTRFLAVTGSYMYYHYEFGGTASLRPGFVRALDRQGARLGLMTRLPLMR